MMLTWLQSRRFAVVFGIVTPTVLLFVYHRMALLLPWHFVLFAALFSASSMFWSLIANNANARVLRFLVLPGLAFAVLFTLLISIVSVPLAFFSLVGFGHRLVSYFDLQGAISLFALACCGVSPAASLLAFLGQLSAHLEKFHWQGWGSKISLLSIAALLIAACFYGASLTETKMQALMLEKPWRPNGVLHRLFQFDAICEVSCRDMFVQAFNAKRDTDVGYLEQNFQLLYGEELNATWQNERFSGFGFTSARVSKP
jgi:hypothetical protein